MVVKVKKIGSLGYYFSSVAAVAFQKKSLVQQRILSTMRAA